MTNCNLSYLQERFFKRCSCSCSWREAAFCMWFLWFNLCNKWWSKNTYWNGSWGDKELNEGILMHSLQVKFYVWMQGLNTLWILNINHHWFWNFWSEHQSNHLFKKEQINTMILAWFTFLKEAWTWI